MKFVTVRDGHNMKMELKQLRYVDEELMEVVYDYVRCQTFRVSGVYGFCYQEFNFEMIFGELSLDMLMSLLPVWYRLLKGMSYMWSDKLFFLVGKPEGRGSLGRPRRRWENGIRMCIWETGSF
jgi:hypothetical protein